MSRYLCRALIVALVALVLLPAVAGEGRTPIYAWQTTITQPGKYIVTRDITPLICNAAVIDIQVPACRDRGTRTRGHRSQRFPGQRLSRPPGDPRHGVRTTSPFATARSPSPTKVSSSIGGANGNRKVVIEDVKIMDVLIAGIQLERHHRFRAAPQQRRRPPTLSWAWSARVRRGSSWIRPAPPSRSRARSRTTQVERTARRDRRSRGHRASRSRTTASRAS